jgi:hypothetical protein
MHHRALVQVMYMVCWIRKSERSVRLGGTGTYAPITEPYESCSAVKVLI